jgi:hypothetical protein
MYARVQSKCGIFQMIICFDQTQTNAGYSKESNSIFLLRFGQKRCELKQK